MLTYSHREQISRLGGGSASMATKSFHASSSSSIFSFRSKNFKKEGFLVLATSSAAMTMTTEAAGDDNSGDVREELVMISLAGSLVQRKTKIGRLIQKWKQAQIKQIICCCCWWWWWWNRAGAQRVCHHNKALDWSPQQQQNDVLLLFRSWLPPLQSKRFFRKSLQGFPPFSRKEGPKKKIGKTNLALLTLAHVLCDGRTTAAAAAAD